MADQLGPHFDDGGDVLLIEAKAVLARRPYHWAKAHLILSALRHRAAELGERARYVRADHYRDVLRPLLDSGETLDVINPTSWGSRALVQEFNIPTVPSRGFVSSEEFFQNWAAGKKAGTLKLENYYRHWRDTTGILMEGFQPAGGQYNYDHDNRQPPPKGASNLGLPAPWSPQEDDIDAQVRQDLREWVDSGEITLLGREGPRRCAVTHAEAREALSDFIETRLMDFGPFEDASLLGDDVMAHSMLSVPLNLGLLDPREVIDECVAAYHRGDAPLGSVEAVVRQIAGWRDWVWHLYWHLGPEYVESSNYLSAHEPLPPQFWELSGENVSAACMKHVLATVGDTGYAHHIQRLMILGNWSLQRGYNPQELNEWFTDAFVDGTPWVMPANVIGMSQHADGGLVATKPYSSGGAYINSMSDFCVACPFNPKVRLGENACPFTAGYWSFLHRVEPLIRGNHRMAQPLAGMRKLADLDAVVEQEKLRTHW
ncbi:cryptochrome/photolyase family protein [Aurantimicrobium minutum]|uniref:cryptochrome/photolyase family protein n=1 Tax=Aurantimicrobium minutum TaxID=708131 RepID=UPI002475D359|nr:cryptochrome/photolyase family protein [Aurantimicrobium minutum]